MSYVWLIGGSQMSVPMIDEIHRRGLKVFLTDGNFDCVGVPLVDWYVNIDVYDIEAHVQRAKNLQHRGINIIAVLCIGCDAGPTQSAVAEALGLPGHVSTVTAIIVKNKALMRQHLRRDKKNIQHPIWLHFDKDKSAPQQAAYMWESLTYDLKTHMYPCVVKSLNDAGSRGFAIVGNRTALITELRSRDEALIEEYLAGVDVIPELREHLVRTDEAAFDFLLVDGEVKFLNGALRMFWEAILGIEAGHFNPCLPDNEIMEKARLAAELLGVNKGVLKLDMKLTSEYGWCILEAATRPSGGFDHMYSCPMGTGKDVTGIILDNALGLPFDETKLQAHDGVACCYAPVYQAGEVKSWLIGEMPNIDHEIFLTHEDKIPVLKTNQDRPVFVISVAKNHLDAMKQTIELSKAIVPDYLDY